MTNLLEESSVLEVAVDTYSKRDEGNHLEDLSEPFDVNETANTNENLYRGHIYLVQDFQPYLAIGGQND